MVWQIDLSSKCVIVTGGNRGIGLAISEQVAQAGAHVAIIYRSSQDAPEVAERIAEKYGVRCTAFQCDVTDQAAVQAVVGKVYKDIGPVAGVVCNAGVAISKPALEMTKEDFDNQMEPNVWGCFTVAQAAAKLWKEHDYQNGRIVFVSSMSASIANRNATQCFYNPSKAALNLLAKSLAMEWAHQGILVNCLSPGFVDTDMNQVLRDDKDFLEKTEDLVMLKRISKPEEQAGAVLFFLSDYASYTTGTELIVDGGASAW